MTTQEATSLNGVDVDQLVATVNLIRQKPKIAHFRFRAHNEWMQGRHSRTTIQGFYGAGQEDSSRSHPLVLDGDEPPVLLGGNAGPNAVEAVLHALASGLAVGFIYNAAAQGITVESLTFDLKGESTCTDSLGCRKRSVRATGAFV